MSTSFHDLGLIPELLQTVQELGYIEPTPIQVEAIPALLAGRDVMGQAQTGTGKTAAFTLPMLQYLEGEALQGLILTPTRELAIQIAEAVYRYGHMMGVKVLPIYGGQPYSRQTRRLEKGVHVVVGTPGRVLDLIRQKALKLEHVRYLVLDEADEMLKMGFIDDVEAILAAAQSKERQTALFSATLPDVIQRLARKYMHNPQVIAIEPEGVTVENISQQYYIVKQEDKVAALSRLLEVEDMKNTLVFCRTKVGAAELTETLVARGYRAEAIHGDLPQPERERILRRFRNQQVTILVATDVVARGVDIPEVSHVINFDVPQLPIEYVHRIGRTGRAGRAGSAIMLITPRERHVLKSIEHYTHHQIRKAKLPTREQVLVKRDEVFKAEMMAQMETLPEEADFSIVEALLEEGFSLEHIALTALTMLRAHENQRPLEHIADLHDSKERERERKPTRAVANGNAEAPRKKRRMDEFEPGMVRLYMDLGKADGLRPGDLVYSVASQADIPGKAIGAIDIRHNETYFDVAEAHVEAVLNNIHDGHVRGNRMTIVLAEGVFEGGRPSRAGNGHPKGNGNGHNGQSKAKGGRAKERPFRKRERA